MLFEIETQKSLGQIDKDMRDAAAKHKFGVLGVHDLRDAMEKKGGTLRTHLPRLRSL